MSRLIHARMLLAIAIAVTIGVLELGSMIAPNMSTPAEQNNALAINDNIPMLSTISVSAAEEIPMLPLVIVRPLVVQHATYAPVEALASMAQQNTPLSSSGMPHVRLDMPYYSFGKMLPNVIKD